MFEFSNQEKPDISNLFGKPECIIKVTNLTNYDLALRVKYLYFIKLKD